MAGLWTLSDPTEWGDMWRMALMAVLLLACVAPTACIADPEPPRLVGPIRVATGNEGGVFSALGGAYVDVLRREFPDVEVTAQPSDGSVENVRSVVSGRAEVGFALGSIAGNGVASGQAGSTSVVALAHLYDNYVQIVVPAGSRIRTIQDLRGTRISVGSPGSATSVMASAVLDVAGIQPGRNIETVHLDLKESADALADGSVDAFVWGGGIPTSAITELHADVGVRLVDLGRAADRIVQLNGELFTATSVPASVYGMDSAVTTVSVPAYLVAPRTMPEAQAYWLTRMLFDGQAELIRAHPEGRRIDLRMAIETYPLDLHPGAERWYREEHR